MIGYRKTSRTPRRDSDMKFHTTFDPDSIIQKQQIWYICYIRQIDPMFVVSVTMVLSLVCISVMDYSWSLCSFTAFSLLSHLIVLIFWLLYSISFDVASSYDASPKVDVIVSALLQMTLFQSTWWDRMASYIYLGIMRITVCRRRLRIFPSYLGWHHFLSRQQWLTLLMSNLLNGHRNTLWSQCCNWCWEIFAIWRKANTKERTRLPKSSEVLLR